MPPGTFLPLASIEAVRPVFMIVMGIFLMVIAWRFAKDTSGWTPRLLVAGALLLGFGYTLVMPLYEAGLIERYSASGRYQGNGASAVGWHVVKLMMMNIGWLLFGVGMAMHAQILRSPAPRVKPSPLASHESVA
jgi:hypothetical protein